MSWFSQLSNLSSLNNKAFPDQGSDGSGKYVQSKACECVIGQYSTSAVISFKPFINSLSYSIENKNTEDKSDFGRTERKINYVNDSIYVSIDLGLDLLAHSVNEAKRNQKRINELYRIFTSIRTDKTYSSKSYETDVRIKNLCIISLNSLIGVSLSKGVKVNTFQKLIDHGVPGFIESWDISIDKALGFLEYGGDLLPKKYTLKLKFKVSNGAYYQITEPRKFLWLPNLNGKFYSNDSMSFPLGMKKGFTSLDIGADGSDNYSQNKNCYITIDNFFSESNIKNRRVFTTFKPFDLDISKSFKYPETVKIDALPNTGGTFFMTPKTDGYLDIEVKVSFSILNHSINEAILNTNRVQRIFRLSDGYQPNINPGSSSPTSAGEAIDWPQKKSAAPKIYFVINNLVSAINQSNKTILFWKQFGDNFNNQFNFKSFSFEIDKEMGFFEFDGLLLCKKINLSFTLEPVYSQNPIYKLNNYSSKPNSSGPYEENGSAYWPVNVDNKIEG